MKHVILLTFFISVVAFAQSSEPQSKIKYRKGKRIDFESLLVEGENKKPELSVVTGNLGEKDLGLLKLRENFTDLMANDAGEEIQ